MELARLGRLAFLQGMPRWALVAAGVADRLEHTRERLCPPPRQA